MNKPTVTISAQSAEKIRDWLRDMMKALHMAPSSNDYEAFIELHGAIEDSHYEEKHGTISDADYPNGDGAGPYEPRPKE